MSKTNRVFNVFFGLVIACVVGVIGRHIYMPSYVTVQITSAVLVTVGAFLGFLAYDTIKEGLTGKRS